MSLSSACGLSASGTIDTIVCLYCRALIAFSGLPANRYSDHLRNEHNILVPDELQFSISRTLKKTFEKKAGVARIKLQSFSEASRLDDPMNMVEFNNNADQDYNGNNTIVSQRDVDMFQDEKNMIISINPINDEDQSVSKEVIENVQDENMNNCEMKEPVKEEPKEGIVDYKSSENEETMPLPNIPQLKLPKCYVKIEQFQFTKFSHKPKSSHRKKKATPTPEPLEVPWYEFKFYRCLLCDVEVFLGSVDRHLSVVHNSDVASYLTKFPQEADSLSIPLWSCAICGENTSWMHRTITHHLHTKHDHMDINQYYFVHVLGIKKEKEEDFSENKIKIEPLEIPEELEIPLKLPWYEGSWHRCHICQEIFTFGYFVKTHIKKVHGMTQAKYFSQNPSASSKLADWTCQICSKRIKWMNDSIYRHLKYGHRMSKTEYQQTYLEEEESVVGNVTDETLTGEETDEIELPGVPEIGDATKVLNSRKSNSKVLNPWVLNTKVLNPFHSPLPRNDEIDKVETEVKKKDTEL